MKIRQEKGITLVALIITIIVLVILAAVTINAAFNSGIIDTAVNGAVNYADAQKKEQITFEDLDKNIQDIVNKIEDYNIGENNPGTNPTPVPDTPTQDGSYDEAKGVNTPKVEGTGLIPVYHNGSTWVDLTSSSTAEEWNNWYNYDTTNKKWANARTKDGSMWVWIPRYEYKIDSTAKTIDVNFIEGTSTETTSGYTLHPAFGTDLNNGGWSSDIAGFWIAKYPAGWQNGTDGEASIGTPDMSNIVYQTSVSGNTYAGTITNGTTKMSYPVFKANTYAYNLITVGDAYTLSQDIKNASRYGLSNVDSHLEKNSEWGAVTYLAHSKYGVNGQDLIQPNTTNRNNSPVRVYAVTSLETVVNTSTTQNITGIYDMSGCVGEHTSALYGTGSKENTTGMPTSRSSKYVTIYTSAKEINGDATFETSNWNSDNAAIITSNGKCFIRGGMIETQHDACGIFSYWYGYGSSSIDYGFRVVLIPN